MVLLLGDADDDAIPAFSFRQADSSLASRTTDSYISDDPYQDLDSDGLPDIALGRIPARSAEEAVAVLDKIKTYEQAQLASSDAEPDPATSAWRRRITYIAGEGHFGAMDSMLETMFKKMVDAFVPAAFEVSMTYAHPASIYCPPPASLKQCALDRLQQGSLLFNYVGHGFETGLDSLHWADRRIRIMSAADIARIPNHSAPRHDLPIALLSCCSTGWFDMDQGRRCYAEELLLHATSGAVAVIAGSRITHPYANTILQKDITQLLLVERIDTVGELDLRAMQSLLHTDATDRELDLIAAPIAAFMKWPSSLQQLRRMHVRMYNLLGDPATRIALPANNITDIRISDGSISGRVDRMHAGRVAVTVETARISMSRPADLAPVVGKNDPDLEAKAARNYVLANDRLLLSLSGEVVDGAFSIPLPAALPTAAHVIRVAALGRDSKHQIIDAIGALTLAKPVTRVPMDAGAAPAPGPQGAQSPPPSAEPGDR
jgi:hypothetical protein